MVRAAFAEKGSPLLKEGHWRALSVVGLAVVRCSLPLAGGAPRLGAVVGVAVEDDGVVPGCPGGGAPQSPRVVLDVPDDGAFEDPVERWDVADGERGAAAAVDELVYVHARTSPMKSLARRPQ